MITGEFIYRNTFVIKDGETLITAKADRGSRNMPNSACCCRQIAVEGMPCSDWRRLAANSSGGGVRTAYARRRINSDMLPVATGEYRRTCCRLSTPDARLKAERIDPFRYRKPNRAGNFHIVTLFLLFRSQNLPMPNK